MLPEPPVWVALLKTSLAELNAEPFQYLPVATCRIETTPEETPEGSVAEPQRPAPPEQPAFQPLEL